MEDLHQWKPGHNLTDPVKNIGLLLRVIENLVKDGEWVNDYRHKLYLYRALDLVVFYHEPLRLEDPDPELFKYYMDTFLKPELLANGWSP